MSQEFATPAHLAGVVIVKKLSLTKSRLRSTALIATVIASMGFSEASAQFYGVPNRVPGLGPTSVTVGGQVFVNHGMVGAGRSLASLRDFNGDTLGSFSGMALDLTTWRRAGGGYSGLLYTLPDRGYNDVFFSNYRARISAFNLAFTPHTGGTLPQEIASQNQVTLTYNAGRSFFLNDFNNAPTTGEDPGAGTVTQNGNVLPAVPAGREGAGRVSIDAEALAFRRDGTFYVGDEYTGGIYHYDATGKMIGFLAPPPAIAPRSAGVTNFNSIAQPTTSGRRNNQGMESLSLAPDGKTLFGVLQSSTVQDSIAADQSTRKFTRVLVYDVSTNPAPSAPTAHYVLQLPTFDRDGIAGAADRTAAQSDILALNKSQFLMLSRDGNGVDNGDSNPIVFKSIMLVDITGATNIAGTPFETSATPVAPGGVLAPNITTVASVQFVNMLNTDKLTRFGLNLDANPADLARTNNRMTLSEKWEAIALAPVLDESSPQDFFLFVGNDNDFQTRTGFMVGDLNYATYDDGVENDNMLLVYRLTLPTYVDPMHLLALETTAPLTARVLGLATDRITQENSLNITAHLNSQRNLGSKAGGPDQGVTFWGSLGQTWGDNDAGDLADFTVGFGYRTKNGFEVGAALGEQESNGDGGDFSYDHGATKVSVYGGYANNGWFANGSYTYGNLEYSNILRPASYGQTARGATKGKSYNVRAEGGKLYDFGALKFGPVIGARTMTAELDGYSERGASGANVTFSPIEAEVTDLFGGAEATTEALAGIISARVLYNSREQSVEAKTAFLTSAQSSLGAIQLSNTEGGEDFVAAELGYTSSFAGLNVRVGYDARIGTDSDETAHRVSLGFAKRF